MATAPATLRTIEINLRKANKLCAKYSGLPAYPTLDRERKALLREALNFRPLSRIEYILLNGYMAWVDAIAAHGLPENHPVADF